MKKENTSRYVRITPVQKHLEWQMKELWEYRDLILLLTKKRFTIRYKQTILGPLWAFLYPVAASLIMTLVFGEIVRVDTDGIPHVLFYLCSNALWAFFSECVRGNARTFTDNAYLFGKVYFPRLTVPVSNLFFSLISFAIQIIVLLGFLLYFIIAGVVSPVYACWPLLPFLLVILGIQGVSVGVIISSLTTKYRDLAIVVDFGVQLWMYVSPVVYPLSSIQNGFLRALMLLNPVTAPMECFRKILLGQGSIEPVFLTISLAVTAVLAVCGILIFNRVEKTFMDTV